MLKRAKKKNLETVPMTYEFMKILLKHRQIKKKLVITVALKFT